MISKKTVALLNEQFNLEVFSAYLYLEIANYYETEGLVGFANWVQIQVQEELDHAMLIRTYLHNNEEKLILEAIGKPSQTFKNYEEPLHLILAHEKEITASIHNIYGVAMEEKDYRTTQFLDWFIMEQGEEEKNAHDLIGKYQMFGNDAKTLYLLDQELAGRVYAPPSLTLD